MTNPANPGPQDPCFNSPKVLQDNLDIFLTFDQDTQRSILRDLIIPLVSKHAIQDLTSKITEMLIDLSVLKFSDILDFLTNEALLQERVNEAKKIIKAI